MTETEKLLLRTLDEFEKDYRTQVNGLKSTLQDFGREYGELKKENQRILKENQILNEKLNRLIDLLEPKKKR